MANKQDVSIYLKQGYIHLFFCDDDELNDCDIITVDINEYDIDCYFKDIDKLRERFAYEEEVVLIKFLSRYHIKPLDILKILKKQIENTPNYYSLIFWLYFISLSDDKEKVFLPNIDENKEDYEDFLFEKEDHLVSFVIDNLNSELEKETVNETIFKYYTFINNIIYSSKENYDDITKKIILKMISGGLDNKKNISNEVLTYFHLELEKLAKKEDNWAMLCLGYNCYEGTNSFDVDYTKSCYYLEKYFEKTGDPDVARTLGYIYYYGRNNNGVPIKDKAFQYFSIAHISGDNAEATYKLADCYVNGYGTMISHISAFKLVESIYVTNLKSFLKGEESKFADIALRMGNYYKDGIYVDKNLYEAQRFYLEALCAIEDRMSNINYIGDMNVKNRIISSLNEVNKELNIRKIDIIKDKYLLKNQRVTYEDCDLKIEILNDTLHILITKKLDDEEKYLINIASEISYVSKTEKIEYLLKPCDACSLSDFVNSITGEQITKIVIDDNYFIVILKKDIEIPSIILCEKIYLKIK